MQFVAFDDFEDPTPRLSGGKGGPRPLIAGIGKDANNERPQSPRAVIENECGAVAILDVGRMHGDAQQQTERIDEDVPLAPCNLLARIVALRVERSPPFGAVLALWLSMIAAVGLASRPACSRTAT